MKYHLLITAMMLASLTPAAKTLRLGDNPAQLLKSTTVSPQTPQFDISVA